MKEMRTVISGKTCDNKPFVETVLFQLFPPKDGEFYYGTGHHLKVTTPQGKEYIDVRYERTTDIEILADRWIDNHYGENAELVVKFINRKENR